MKIDVYDIINDPLPKLYTIKTIDVEKELFTSDKGIVNMFNDKLNMDKLNSEHIYALSLTYGLIPRGIIQVSIGKCDSCDADLRGLAIGLLLTGAEQFMMFHNHPGGNKGISDSDKYLSEEYRKLGNTIGIKYIKHIMITQKYFGYCDEITDDQPLPFSN